MPFGQGCHFDWIIVSFAEAGALAIEVAFQFVVENDAERATAGLLDSVCLGVEEAIERGVVFGFPRFDDSVEDRLILGKAVRGTKEPLPCLRETNDPDGSAMGSREGSFDDESLMLKVTQVAFHAGRIASIGMAGEVLGCDDPEGPKVGHGSHFGLAKLKGAAPECVRLGPLLIRGREAFS
jgi:hypothetical protein